AAVQAATAGAVDFADFKRRLRIVRRHEVLRLGARELGWGTTLEVARELSDFAAACLQEAWRFCDGELRREYGPPMTEEGPAAFVVLAMGKLGGEELNFSSDVDVCYFYSSDAGEAGPISLHQYFSELSRRISNAIEEKTADGSIFRVDLRLRPEGQNGPICNSLPAAERYYETFGRTWERQALLRARPCAGDAAFGQALLDALEGFIYPRHLEAKMVDDIRQLRTMFRAQGDAPRLGAGSGGLGGFDVKLGTGGIRDVELVVQTLQLLHAGKRRDLRDRTTLSGLYRLLMAGLISDREAKTLAEAYRFWRRLEHRVQVEDGAQTHRLPADDEQRAWFAQRLGFADLATFDQAVTRHRQDVQAIAATFNDPPQPPGGSVLRLLDPGLPREEMEALLASLGFTDVEGSANALELVRGRIPPTFLEQSAASPDPSRALAHFRDLTVRGSTGLMALLRDHPQLLRMLATLFGTSERLSTLLIQRPELWEPLIDNLGARVRSPDELAAALRQRLSGGAGNGGAGAVVAAADSDDSDEETRLRALRRFQSEELLRIGLHDVSGNLDPAEVSEQLSALAQACLGEVMSIVLPALEARYGQPRAALTVLGLGSLGAREMRYGSDLDLVFLYGGPGESSTGVDHQEWYARASPRVIGALQALTEEGRLYHVDTRLRPSGAQGMLVTSYAAFQRYHEREAAGWERAALLRARVVYSTEPPAGVEAVASLVAGIAYERSFDEAKFRADLRAVRQRVENERGRVPRGSRHLRFDPGGIMDIEFLVALGQLQGGATDLALRTTTTMTALRRLAQLGWPSSLLDDYAFLRRLSLRLRLLRDRPEEVLSPQDAVALARTLERDAAAMLDDLDRRMARVREIFSGKFQ
ncbi:MAG TPA: bifunctional [glutamate--ammonia ligase]-adenylyl-L-tyrosine phosphorylase/[glutamate--ammonia-ligase] adenylyltransferase, partial [Polyangia bacterium]|nr:bifunctional [glutamate--ammonia ligase]-adenylyl-L-tyrosine phosphorylase/[glutamate--ammonia-ligase] adenylyltransferase [Polyangia bacterium]